MKIGFIDYYLDEWHANEYPAMLKENSGGEIQVAWAWAGIDGPGNLFTNAEWSAKQNIPLCGSIAEVIEKSDALIVLSPDNVEQHEALCQLPLASGKRCYVDKTFAPDRTVAEALFERAEKHGTPCFSSSALRFAKEYTDLAVGSVCAASSAGPNDFETYSIHQLEPLSMLIPSPPRRVIALENSGWASLLVEYDDGRVAALNCTGREDTPFTMLVCGENESASLKIESEFFTFFIQRLIEFFKTGTPPVPAAQTIAIMALREAGIEALRKSGTWVRVP